MAPRHVVMFSSGAGSWAAARRVADQHGTENLVLLFSDVKGEDEDNYRFLVEAAADIFGVNLPVPLARNTRLDWMRLAVHVPGLVWLADGRDIWQVFEDRRFLGNSRIANCSIELKQKPARSWLDANCLPEETKVYVGIDWSEENRLPAIENAYQPFTAKAPLCVKPYLDKPEILADLRSRGIEPPRLYSMGFPHANCGGGCVRAGQGQFIMLLEQMPERFAEWEANEERLREHLGKPVSILRDWKKGSSGRLTLTQLRERVEAKREADLDRDDIGGCGCFVADEVAES